MARASPTVRGLINSYALKNLGIHIGSNQIGNQRGAAPVDPSSD